MSWQINKMGVGPGRTPGFLPPFNPFAFPAASVRTRTSDELSLTATTVPSRGVHPHVATVPRERANRLAMSDPQGVQYARQEERIPIHRRTRTEERKFESGNPPGSGFVRPPSSQRILPPLHTGILQPLASRCELELHVAEEQVDSQPSLEETESDEDSSTEEEDEDEVKQCQSYLYLSLQSLIWDQ